MTDATKPTTESRDTGGQEPQPWSTTQDTAPDATAVQRASESGNKIAQRTLDRADGNNAPYISDKTISRKAENIASNIYVDPSRAADNDRNFAHGWALHYLAGEFQKAYAHGGKTEASQLFNELGRELEKRQANVHPSAKQSVELQLGKEDAVISYDDKLRGTRSMRIPLADTDDLIVSPNGKPSPKTVADKLNDLLEKAPANDKLPTFESVLHNLTASFDNAYRASGEKGVHQLSQEMNEEFAKLAHDNNRYSISMNTFDGKARIELWDDKDHAARSLYYLP